MNGKLFVVGTPIGNLSDMSPRAIETLKNVDFIAAEDTRVTLKLLNAFNIKKSMISYFEHNKRERGDIIISKIESGQTCALVSDAGMPAISDPGEELIKQCEEKGICVNVIPGPTALTAALSISGLSTGRFTFEGFLSVNKKNRLEHLNSLKNETRTMIFYEAPHKLKHTLKDMLEILGNRKVSIVRELTKIHEEVLRTDLKYALNKYENETAKGEFVLILEGSKVEIINYSLQDAIEIAKSLENKMSISEAAKEAAKVTGIKKGEIYKKLL